MPDWDAVYAEKKVENATPADILIMNQHLLPMLENGHGQKRVLDYACGLGGNGIYLAKKGYSVTAWDLSATAVKKINRYAGNQRLQITAEVHDLENSAPAVTNTYDIVIVSFFLHRQSLRYIYNLLKNGGLLFYQTFSGEPVNGDGPSNVNFRLYKNELLREFSDMQLLFYREDDESASKESRQGLTYFVAKK